MVEPSDEHAVVLRCADPTGVSADPFSDIDTDALDWCRLIQLGSSHGVLPLLGRHRSAFDRAAPSWFVDRLTAENRAIAARDRYLADTLASVTNRFEAENIRMLSFKGPVLGRAVYPQDVHRAYGDLDLLVDRSDFERAVSVLRALGFTSAEGLPPPRSAVDGGVIRPPMLQEYSMVRNAEEIELRWRIGDTDRAFRPDFSTLWQRRTRVDVGGQPVPALHPVDRLQMLAFHGTKHRWHQLKWVADFSAGWSTHEHQQESVFEAAGVNGNRRRVLLAVALSASLFRTPVSGAFSQRLDADRTARRLAEASVADLVAGSANRPSSIDRLVYNLRAADTLEDRCRMLLWNRSIHPTPPEYQLLPLPAPLQSAYYLLRPLRLLTGRVTGTHP